VSQLTGRIDGLSKIYTASSDAYSHSLAESEQHPSLARAGLMTRPYTLYRQLPTLEGNHPSLCCPYRCCQERLSSSSRYLRRLHGELRLYPVTSMMLMLDRRYHRPRRIRRYIHPSNLCWKCYSQSQVVAKGQDQGHYCPYDRF
jgi:hypothetical protein